MVSGTDAPSLAGRAAVRGETDMSVRIVQAVVCASGLLLSGCVPREAHQQLLTNLEEARKAEAEARKAEAEARKSEAQAAVACESFKKKTMAELDTVHQQKAKLMNDLAEARNGAKDVETKLAVEQVKVATLREEKQKLMTGTTTTKDEIARIQKRVGELETSAARAFELEKRLEDREQEISRLQEAAAERDVLNTKVAALMQEREQLKAELQRQRDAVKSAK
jgi:chromosome segregation ATPase